MTFDDVQAALRKCDDLMCETDTHLLPERVCFQLEHCGGMIYRAREFTPDKVDKACRWLGFIQGVIYANGLATVDELKAMNRSEM